MLAGLVDNSGYSTGIREKYQAYLITEAALQFGAQTLKPGAYGVGFIEEENLWCSTWPRMKYFGAAFAKRHRDEAPSSVQVMAPETGKYRLYAGREFVESAALK